MDHEERLALLGMTEDEVADQVARSRARQGLPPRIEDRATLARMAALIVKRDEAAPRP